MTGFIISPRILKESWRAIMIVRGVSCCSLLFVVIVVFFLQDGHAKSDYLLVYLLAPSRWHYVVI